MDVLAKCNPGSLSVKHASFEELIPAEHREHERVDVKCRSAILSMGRNWCGLSCIYLDYSPRVQEEMAVLRKWWLAWAERRPSGEELKQASKTSGCRVVFEYIDRVLKSACAVKKSCQSLTMFLDIWYEIAIVKTVAVEVSYLLLEQKTVWWFSRRRLPLIGKIKKEKYYIKFQTSNAADRPFARCHRHCDSTMLANLLLLQLFLFHLHVHHHLKQSQSQRDSVSMPVFLYPDCILRTMLRTRYGRISIFQTKEWLMWNHLNLLISMVLAFIILSNSRHCCERRRYST